MPAMRARPERLAFIDETAVETKPARLRGRALREQRLETNAPFGAWGPQTFIAGSTRNGPIAPWAMYGAMDGTAFAAYIRNGLVPELENRHRRDSRQPCDTQKRPSRRRARSAWLPVPLSAALRTRSQSHRNGFRQTQGSLTRNWRETPRPFADMFDAISEIRDLFTPEECWNCFCDAGYASG